MSILIPQEPVVLVTLMLLKAGNAPKLGKRSAGRMVQYRLWTNAQRDDVYWQIAANDGGGQFSQELVPTAKALNILQTQAGSEPFRTKLLRPAFKGRSANNAGFLVCAMYAEGLIAGCDKAHHHLLGNTNWEEWRQSCLAQAGESQQIAQHLALAALPPDTPEPVTKERRTGKHKAKQAGEDAHAEGT